MFDSKKQDPSITFNMSSPNPSREYNNRGHRLLQVCLIHGILLLILFIVLVTSLQSGEGGVGGGMTVILGLPIVIISLVAYIMRIYAKKDGRWYKALSYAPLIFYILLFGFIFLLWLIDAHNSINMH